MLRSSTKLLPRATLSPLLCLNTQLNVFSWGEFSGTRRNVISYRNQGFSSLPYLDSGQHEINPKLQRRGISSDSNGTNEGKIPKGNNNYSTFHSLKNMHYLSKQALEEVGLKHMTEIQSRTWEPIIDGKDVFGRAHTGTGKTFAFLLPAVERALQGSIIPGKVSILVLSPTRELAIQTASQAAVLAKAHNGKITSHEMVGGTNKRYDVSRLRRLGVPTILVSTPGRLLDHMLNTHLCEEPFSSLFDSLQVLVMDEADALLDMGFTEDIQKILSFCPPPEKRQTLLFSATFSQGVQKMVDYATKSDYVSVDCVGDKEDPSKQPIPEKVDQSFVIIPASRMFSAPIEMIVHLIDNNRKWNVKIMAFFPTRYHVKLYEEMFNFYLGRRVLAIHKEMNQSIRTNTSERFRHAKSAVLLTTDASARGVDYKDVTHVLQFGIPYDRDSYIHRIGRTSRAKKDGKAILVLSSEEKHFLHRVLDGFDLDPNAHFRSLMNGPMEPDTEDSLTDITERIRNGSEHKLKQSVMATSEGMKAYYKSRRGLLGLEMTDNSLDLMTNAFLSQAGVTAIPRKAMPTSKPWSPGDRFDVGRATTSSRK